MTPEASGSWVSTLKEYIKQHSLEESNNFDETHEVDLRLRRIFEERRKQEMEKEPSLAVIPRFFTKKKNVNDIQSKLSKIARSRFLERKQLELLDVDDRERLRVLLLDISSPPDDHEPRMNYEDFCVLKDEFSVEKSRRFFHPSVFLRFPRDKHGRISNSDFFHHVCRRVQMKHMRIELSCYDEEGTGSLKEAELEKYVEDLIKVLPALQGMQENFDTFYICTALRRFFFFLDPKHTRRISIPTLVRSDILQELLALANPEFLSTPGAKRNWFNLSNAQRVYSQYLELDVDQNGMLSKAELQAYGGPKNQCRLTEVFVNRVFQECRTYDGEMDYKTFLDFVLAMENPRTLVSLQYFWRVIDINKCGYITIFTINYFFREIVERLREGGDDQVKVEDVKDEIFDMVKPASPNDIRLSDLVKCSVGHVVISMLTDVNGFWAYDNRENLMHNEEDEEDEAGLL